MNNTMTITREVYNDDDEMVMMSIVFDKKIWKNLSPEDQDEILMGSLSESELVDWEIQDKIISYFEIKRRS